MLKNTFLFIVFLFCVTQKTAAQFSELGLQFGASRYIGDLSVGKFGDAKETHAAAGIFFRNTFLKGWASFRFGINLTKVSGDDRNSVIGSEAYNRNLNFESLIQSGHFILDINIPGISPCEYKFFSPYISGGIEAFHFDPITDYYSTVAHLQPLGTEGQGIDQFGAVPKYSLTQLAVPVGGGVKILCRDIYLVSLEVMYHYTFTDYLDDVSGNYVDPTILEANNGKEAAYLSNRAKYKVQYDANGVGNRLRGDASKKDAFWIASVSVSYLISHRCGRTWKGIDFKRPSKTRCASEF